MATAKAVERSHFIVRMKKLQDSVEIQWRKQNDENIDDYRKMILAKAFQERVQKFYDHLDSEYKNVFIKSDVYTKINQIFSLHKLTLDQ